MVARRLHLREKLDERPAKRECKPKENGHTNGHCVRNWQPLPHHVPAIYGKSNAQNDERRIVRLHDSTNEIGNVFDGHVEWHVGRILRYRLCVTR